MGNGEIKYSMANIIFDLYRQNRFLTEKDFLSGMEQE